MSFVAVLRRFAIASALLLLPSLAGAQFVKTPVGPGIDINPMTNIITANVGEVIEWQIELSNSLSPDPLYADFWDTPQDDECAGGQSRLFSGRSQSGSTDENADQTAISFLDPNGDGNCEETVIDAAGGLVSCDTATQTLVIYNAFVPGTSGGFPPTPGTATLRFLTYLDPATPPLAIMCNWGFVYDDKETPTFDDDTVFQPTTRPGGRTFGCTCMNAAPPNAFDMEATKTAQPDTLPLIPNDPASTITYTITATNTGGEDISGISLSDTLEPGQEWTEIVSCPPPLSCSFTPTTLSVSGWNMPATDPDTAQTVQARAKVTCGAATDDDSGVVCNRGEFTAGTRTIYTDDPDQPGIQDPTCVNVVFSNLTQSEKTVRGYTDNDGDGLLSVGDTVHFSLRARNTGRLLARDVVIRDAALDTTCFDPATIVAHDGGTVAGSVITWNVGDIPGPFGSVEVGFDVNLSAGEVCCNQAELNSEERRECALLPIPSDDPTTAVLAGDPACALPGPRPNLKQDKTWALVDDIDASGDLTAGDIASFTITIQNTGVGTATGAQFRDDLIGCIYRFLAPLPNNLPPSRVYPNEITTTDGTDWGVDNSIPYGGGTNPGAVVVDNLGGANGIVPGETITITFYYVAQGIARCCNQSFVTYTESPVPDPSDDPRTPGLVDDQTCFLDPPTGPQAIFSKSVELFDTNGDGYLGVGDRGRFTLDYTSSGTDPLTSLVVTDAGDACYRVVPGSVVITGAATDGSAGNDVVAVASAPLNPGQVISVTFDVEWLALGTCCNQATASSTEIPADVSNDPTNFIPDDATCAEVEQPPLPTISLRVEKLVQETGCQDPGATLHYTLRVTNAGEAAMSTWLLEDPLPASLTGIVVTPPLTVVGSLVSVRDQPIDPGATLEFTYQAQVPCTAAGGTIANVATLSYDAAGTPRTETAGTTSTWGGPDLATSVLNVTQNDTDADGVLEPGETIDVTIGVANTGGCDARQLVVTADLSTAFDGATAVIGQGGTIVGSIVTWNGTTTPALALMVPGGSTSLTVTVTVAAAVPQDTRVNVTADIVASGHPAGPCGGSPQRSLSSPQICVFCTGIVPVTQDLLWNADVVAPIATALAQLRTVVFNNPTPNTAPTCGDTELDRVRDLKSADVLAGLGAGVVIPGHGAWQDKPLTFYEISERCQVDEGGADDPICLRKSGADLVIRASASPATCP